jgi:hypothetical protein
MTQVPLNIFGGLVASLRPSELPEGASPRTFDTDFMTGRVVQRPGRQNVYSYTGSSAGPNPAFSAVDTSTGATPWSNPTGILAGTEDYATVTLNASGSQSTSTAAGTSIGGGAAWTNPGNIDSSSVYASVALSTSGSSNYTPSNSTGGSGATATATSPYQSESVALGGFSSVAASAATLYVTLSGDVVFAGGTGTVTLTLNYTTNGGLSWSNARNWTSTFASTTVPISISGISNLDTVQIQLVVTAYYSSGHAVSGTIEVSNWYATIAGSGQPSSQLLQAAISGLSVPPIAVITGVEVTLNGYYTGAAPSAALIIVPSMGFAQNLAIPSTIAGSITAGGPGDLWGATWTPASFSAAVFDISISTASSTDVYLNQILVTVYYTLPNLSSDYLDVTNFTFAIASNQSITGIGVALKGYSNAGQTLSMNLLDNGVSLDPPKTITLPAINGVTPLGGATDAWQASLNASIVNQSGFGLRMQVSGGGEAFLDYVTVTVYTTTASANFNFVQSFQAETGPAYTLALDAAGNWWIANETAAPGEFSLALSGTTAGSWGSGQTVYDRAFVANSNLAGPLICGSDIPRQYNFEGQWWDRITQVGPGAPPNFTATTSAGSLLTITAYSVTSNIVTLTYTGTEPTAGEVGTFSGLSSATFLNGQTLIVLGTGLTSTQFQVAFTTGNVGTTSDSGLFTPQYTYGITSITQPAKQSDPDRPGYFESILWSSGPGSTSAGTTITVYYSNAFFHSLPDTTLVNAFNAGAPLYVYITGAAFGNGIWQVTSVGMAVPPGGEYGRWYFTYQVPTSNYIFYGEGTTEVTGYYQITQGTVTTSVPVPGLQPGAVVSVAGASVTAWDGTYPLVESLNSGAFNITQTSLTGGTATYTWALVSGQAPAAGQLVTITNTLNANGILNVTDAVIATATGVTSGSFTITGFASGLTYPTTVEEGQATTAGTQFIIDPGASNAGSTTVNPIYGNSTGGTLTVVGSASSGTLPIGAGTRQGVCFFITRNGGGYTASPPITFTVAEDANYLEYSALPIGPPNVVARGIALTEAGQNGVPGANFYWSDVPTIFTVNQTQYTSSSFLIPDNITTSGKLTFSDAVLLNSDAIDVQGNDFFNLIEIGNPAVIVQYADRTFYIGCQNKIQNFNNLSFDGGYLAPVGGAPPLPLGWAVDPNYSFPFETASAATTQLRVSPVFGNSLYVINRTGASQPIIGMITQSAYQDAWFEPILNPNGISVPYSIRVTCRSPSGGAGSLVFDLTNSNQGIYGTVYATASIPLSSMTTQFQTFTLTLTPGLATIPSGLLLRVWGQNLAPNADYEIDRIEPFPTNQPVLSTQPWISYAESPEMVDGVTGQLTLASQSQDQIMGAEVLHDTLRFKKANSFIETENAPNYEPSQWSAREISQRIGWCGPNAGDYGDEWSLSLHQTGIYTDNGGVPMPFREMQGVPTGDALWDQINWNASLTFWLANDLRARRFYIGVAMKTPNFWLPNAAVNSAPTQPNVMLMCNYDGVPAYSELEEAGPVHVTMFGSLKALDMRRKWSIWQIASPYGGIVYDGGQQFTTLFVCNGTGTGKIYRLIASDIQMTDDGVPVSPLYTTAALPGVSLAQTLQLGSGQKYASKWNANLQGSSAVNGLRVRHLQNNLTDPYPVQAPFIPALTPAMQQNTEWRAEVRGQRVFTEFSMNQNGNSAAGYFELGEFNIMDMQVHQWGSERGVSQ